MNEPRQDNISKVVDLLSQRSNVVDASTADLTPIELHEFFKAKQGLELLDQAISHEKSKSEIARATSVGTQSQTLNGGWTNFATPTDGKIGRFQIVRELGRGGFGVVLLALDPRLDRKVALKIPNDSALQNEEAMVRFEREARAAAMLGHPNIVPIYESGAIGPIKYIAYEYCEGETLASWFKAKDKKIDPNLAACLIAALADALQLAHSRGIIHRDMKPGNVLLDPNSKDMAASIRITDFGLAGIGDCDQTLTKTGAAIGTPAYMSPEQARGEMEVGPSVDIYGLGAMLYELLTGRVPFQSNNNLQTLRAIESDKLISPSSVNPAVNDDLQAVCMKCLEKRSGDRYLNAIELSDDLQRFIAGRPVVARKISRTARVGRWLSSNKVVTAMAVTIFSMMLFGMLFARHQFQVSQANLISTKENYQQARAAVDDLLAAANDPALDGMPTVRQKLLDRAMEYYNWFLSQGHDDPALKMDQVEAFRNIAAARYKLGAYPESLMAYQDAGRLLDELADDDASVEQQQVRFNNQIDIGLLLDIQDQLTESKLAYEAALKTGEESLKTNPNHPGLRVAMARAYKNIGFVYRKLLDFDSAMEYYERSITIRKQLVDEFPNNNEYLSKLSFSYRTLVDWYLSKKQPQEGLNAADACLELSLELVRKEPDNFDFELNLASAYNRLGDVYRSWRSRPNWAEQAIGNYEEAIAIAHSQVKRFPSNLQPVNVWLNSVVNASDVYRQTGQFELALKNYGKAQEILANWSKANGSNVALMTSILTIKLNLSKLFYEQADFENANREIEKGIRFADQIVDERPEYPVLKLKRCSLRYQAAKLHFVFGGFDDAISHLEGCLQDNAGDARPKVFLARLLLFSRPELRDSERARELLERALEIRSASINTNMYLGFAYFYIDDLELATHHLDRAKILASGKQGLGLYARAMVAAKLGDDKEALKYFKYADEWLNKKVDAGPHENEEYKRIRSEAKQFLASHDITQ